jgi:hypothetical protein
MVLEWLRRHDPVLDRHLRTYLFREGPITEIEALAESAGESAGGAAAGGGTQRGPDNGPLRDKEAP